MGTKEQDDRDKKFDAILDGIHAFFTGTAVLAITSAMDAETKHPYTVLMLIKKP